MSTGLRESIGKSAVCKFPTKHTIIIKMRIIIIYRYNNTIYTGIAFVDH